MKYSLLVLPLLALTACATPRESCIYNAQAQLQSLESRIDTAQGNIERGYAISVTNATTEISATCQERRADGTIRTYDCDRTEETSTSIPVAIDVAEERRKLAELQRQVGPLRAATDNAVAQCFAIHPE